MVGNIILYFVVALAIVIFSIMAVTTKKILRAATYLLFVLIGVAIFYFQLGYEFLGAIQVAVYAGGIMVLFVFAILLTHKPNANAAPLGSHRKIAGILASVIGGGLLLWALFTMPMLETSEGVRSLSDAIAGGPDISMKMIGRAFTGTEKYQYLLPFEAVSVLLLACIIGGVTVARKR
ncbi:MAG: NADH-quinone oxidoreductase subunit J [Muribaculaceae bacterium]|nr:NADH-quinone oxidoreductase subunit J [Muribaculaceae bacterium]MDE6559454.1 NADH-quinone oxidoreductase subunit J [Muribaculaceae bacterium]